MSHITVTSRQTRLDIKRIASLSDKDQVNWKLLDGLLFKSIEEKIDKTPTGLFVVSREWLQKVTGSKLNAKVIIENFEKALSLKLYYHRYPSYTDLAATINPINLADLIAYAKTENKIPLRQKVDPVIFDSGEPYTNYRRKKHLHDSLIDIEKVLLDREHPLYEYAKRFHEPRVGKYLQQLVDSKSFEVRERISLIPDDYTREDPTAPRESAYSTWSQVEINAHLGYGGSESTRRIFTRGVNLNQLQTDIRDFVFEDDYNLDFKSMQLAILALEWDLPFAKKLLSANISDAEEDVWQYLDRICGVLDKKQGFKTLLYATGFGKARQDGCYEGRSTKGIKSLAVNLLGSKEAAAKFMKCELIVELLKHRDIRMNQILQDGGGYDDFGEFLPIRRIELDKADEYVDNCDIPLDPTSPAMKAQARRIMAAQAQSREVKLMCQRLDLIYRNPDLMVVDFLHDGLYIHICHNKKSAESALRKIKSTIDKACLFDDLQTSLDIKIRGKSIL